MQAIGGTQSRDELSHLDRVASLLAPVRLQPLGYRATDGS